MKEGLRQENNICIICKKDLGQFSAAKASHLRTHVRDGSLKETKEDDKFVWITTGNDPKEVKEYIPFSSSYKQKVEFPRRMPSIAKSDKGGNISIKCRKCNKFQPTMKVVSVHGQKTNTISSFADERFISIACCGTVTIFPKRKIETLVVSPGREFTE